MFSLTFLKAPKRGSVFSGASVIKAVNDTPGELNRRKGQLAAVVETALKEETPLLILPGELEPGVKFQLVPADFTGTETEPGAPGASPFAEEEAELEAREKAVAEREAAVEKRAGELIKGGETLAAKETELTEREADLVAREKKLADKKPSA